MQSALFQPSGHVFVIKHTHNDGYWKMTREALLSPNGAASQTVAFQRRADAERVASRIWKHKMMQHRWPDTLVADRGLDLASGEHVLYISPSPLEVEERDVEELLLELGDAGMAMSLVDPMPDGGEEDVMLRGSYLYATRDAVDKMRFLNRVFALRARKE